MFKKILAPFKLKFVRNLLIVAGGTAIAQLLYFIMMPIITRMYGPEAFGTFGTFMAIINICGPIVALSYPISIVLPKDVKKAKNLVQLSVLISIVISFLIGLFILGGSNSISALLKIEVYVLIMIPFTVFFYGLFQISEQITIRIQRYDVNAKTAIIQAIVDNSTKIGAGLLVPSSITLILSQSFSVLMRSILIFTILKHNGFKRFLEINFREILNVAKEYKDFPLFRSPQIFINSLSLTFPIIFLTAFFGPTVAGFYEISRQSLNTPVNLLGKAVQDVFYPRINEIYNEQKSITNIITKLLITLFILGSIPFGTIIMFGPSIFSFVFGEEWISAGYYARWLALMSLFMLVTRPVISVIPILKLQGQFLVYEIFSTFFRISALLLGILFYDNSVLAVSLFSITSMISYIILIVYVILKSLKSDYVRKKSY